MTISPGAGETRRRKRFPFSSPQTPPTFGWLHWSGHFSNFPGVSKSPFFRIDLPDAIAAAAFPGIGVARGSGVLAGVATGASTGAGEALSASCAPTAEMPKREETTIEAKERGRCRRRMVGTIRQNVFGDNRYVNALYCGELTRSHEGLNMHLFRGIATSRAALRFAPAWIEPMSAASPTVPY